jgi:hypothetical protein
MTRYRSGGPLEAIMNVWPHGCWPNRMWPSTPLASSKDPSQINQRPFIMPSKGRSKLIIRLLLMEKSLDPNDPDHQGWTPPTGQPARAMCRRWNGCSPGGVSK